MAKYSGDQKARTFKIVAIVIFAAALVFLLAIVGGFAQIGFLG